MYLSRLKGIILAGLLAGMIFLVGSSLFAAEKKPTVGFAVSSVGETYHDALIRGAQIAADDLGFNLVVKGGQMDAALVDKNVRAFIAQKVDFILLQTPDPKRLRPACQAAYDANIPVIVVNLGVDAPQVAYVGIDFIAEGRKFGELIAEALNGKGTVAYVSGFPGSDWTVERTRGMEEVLAQYPDIKVLDTQYARSMREEALVITGQFLTAYPDVDLIASITGGQTLGVVEAVKEAGKVGEVKVVSFDFPNALIPLIKSGEVYGTAYTFPVDIGHLAVEVGVFIVSLEHPSQKWESVPAPAGGVQKPAWKNICGSIRTGSKQATIQNIDEVAGDAY